MSAWSSRGFIFCRYNSVDGTLAEPKTLEEIESYNWCTNTQATGTGSACSLRRRRRVASKEYQAIQARQWKPIKRARESTPDSTLPSVTLLTDLPKAAAGSRNA